MASWQVDIPGLSRLVMGAGAHGLKQMVLSGVDIHTIGCMLMVSELIPASQDFRTTLNARRERQRTECQWLYNLVEIGAGSSFLVDHLLKTRAGENVLALLASIVPLMSPDACSAALSVLFDTAGVPFDHTPGVNQFHKLRGALVSFARTVGFQERVLRYHSLLERIVSRQSPQATTPIKRCPFDAMPSKYNLPRVIQFCHKIATSGDIAILVYKGFQGSGWVAAYANFILGFSVCAVDSAGVQIPISDSYGKAKVIMQLAAKESACELLMEGNLTDFISIEPMDQPSRRAWSVNCSELDFLVHNLPELTDPNHVNTVSEIAAVSTLNEVVQRASHIGTTDSLPGFQTYFVSVLPQIQERSLHILSLLGFKAKQRGHYRFDMSFHCEGTHNDALLACNLIRQFRDEKTLIRILKRRDATTKKDSPLYRISDRVCEVLGRAILFASQMAFTDWNTTLQTMSVHHFHGHTTSRTILTCATPAPVHEPGPFEGLGRAILACTDAIDEQTLTQKIFTPDWLGLNLDGVIVLRTLSNCHSITKVQGRVFSLLPGYISFEGQQREVIRMAFENDVRCKPITSLNQDVQPMDCAPALRSRFLFSGSGDTLWARHEILDGSELFTVAHPVDISAAIRKMLVAQPCAHPYNTIFKDPDSLRKEESPFALFPGLTLYKSDRTPHSQLTFDGTHKYLSFLYYQQVEKNDFAQWLACQWHRGYDHNPILILQDNACLQCIIRRIIGNRNKFLDRTLGFGEYCIIAGRTNDLG